MKVDQYRVLRQANGRPPELLGVFSRYEWARACVYAHSDARDAGGVYIQHPGSVPRRGARPRRHVFVFNNRVAL